MNSNSGAEFNHVWSGNDRKHPFIRIGKHENPIKAQSLSMQYTFTPFHALQKDISVGCFSKWSSQIKVAINYALKPTTMYSPLPFNSASTASAKIPVACSICWCVLSASSAQMPGQTNAVLFVTNVWCTGNLYAIPFMVKPVKPRYSKQQSHICKLSNIVLVVNTIPSNMNPRISHTFPWLLWFFNWSSEEFGILNTLDSKPENCMTTESQ